MPLGIEVRLGPVDTVLDGTQLPRSKKRGAGTAVHHFWHMYCAQTVRWIKMPLGLELGLSPGDPARKGALQPPTFRRMSKLVVQGSWLFHRG